MWIRMMDISQLDNYSSFWLEELKKCLKDLKQGHLSLFKTAAPSRYEPRVPATKFLEITNLTHFFMYLFISCLYMFRVGPVAQRLPTGWTVRGSNPDGARFSAPVQTGPEAHQASCTMGTGSFPGVRCCRGVTLTPHPLLVQRSKIE